VKRITEHKVNFFEASSTYFFLTNNFIEKGLGASQGEEN
jgi:hypothetical protein